MAQRPDGRKVLTSFARWLQDEMNSLDWDRSRLAQESGIPLSTISSWFNSGVIPQTRAHRAAIATTLAVSLQYVDARCGDATDVPEPEYPALIRVALQGLEDWELQVVASTARGLREARQDPSLDEVRQQQSAPADR